MGLSCIHTGTRTGTMMKPLAFACMSAFLYLTAVAPDTDWRILAAIKAAPVLLYALICLSKPCLDNYNKHMAFGFILSAVGDVSLAMIPRTTNTFLGGMAGFGAAHLFFISAFGSGVPMRLERGVHVFGLGASAVMYMWPGLGEFRYP